VGVGRLYRLLDLEAKEPPQTEGKVVGRLKGHVVFSGVRFGYEDRVVLNDLSLEARPGETVAIIGPSGIGKSTIVSLLVRFHRPWEGSISIDGQDIAGLTLGSLRDQVALVGQDTVLFGGTIRENIRLGRPEATDAEVEAAAEAAQATAFIAATPKGFETRVGERGTNLSGGQRQRIAIARAILKNAPILVLDEATSALDAPTEAQVRQALAHLMRGRTTLLLAHRRSTLMDADRIYVLEDGTVVASGPPAEVLGARSSYQHLLG